MKGFRYLRGALAEANVAAAAYERERPTLGKQFSNEIEAAIMHAREFPAAAPRLKDKRQELRSINLETFPIKIVYAVEAGLVVIVAVFHQRRRPGYWRRRVRR